MNCPRRSKSTGLKEENRKERYELNSEDPEIRNF